RARAVRVRRLRRRGEHRVPDHPVRPARRRDVERGGRAAALPGSPRRLLGAGSDEGEGPPAPVPGRGARSGQRASRLTRLSRGPRAVHAFPFKSGPRSTDESPVTNRAAPRRDLHTAALVAGWLLAAAAGLFGLLRYGHAPGAAGLAPAAWPDDCGLARAPDRPTLLLFAHPRCPCTVASVHELARLVADVGGAIGGHVLFTRPAGVDDDFTDT